MNLIGQTFHTLNPLRTLLGKELQAVLGSPVGYSIAAVFLLVLGYTFSLTLFNTKVANLQYIFHQMYVLSILLLPALTMRAFAEERRNETLELLLTAPVSEFTIVFAKFLATYVLVLGIYCGALVYAVILAMHGDPDVGPMVAGYLALACLAAALVSVGILISAFTENQVIAAAFSIGTFLMLWFIDSVTSYVPGWAQGVVINLSLIGHFKPLATGSVFASDIGYFVSVTMLALWLATRRLQERG